MDALWLIRAFRKERDYSKSHLRANCRVEIPTMVQFALLCLTYEILTVKIFVYYT